MKNVYISVGTPTVTDGLDSTNPSSASMIGTPVPYSVVSNEEEGGLAQGNLALQLPRNSNQHQWRDAIIAKLAILADENNWVILRIVFPDYYAVTP